MGISLPTGSSPKNDQAAPYSMESAPNGAESDFSYILGQTRENLIKEKNKTLIFLGHIYLGGMV